MKLKEAEKSIKKTLSKIWFLLWKDESWKGWLFSVIFIAVFIKFIFFPVLSLATGTNLPLAIVESCSMYHEGNLFSNFDGWWQRHERKYTNFDVNKGQFYDFKFKNGFNKGDILFIIGTKPEKIKIGDVIIFNAGMQNPLIHRIIEIKQDPSGYLFSTIGDNNNGQLEIERDISEDQLIGKAVFKLSPYLGWGKLIFYEQFKTKSERGFCEER
ncbi:MAG TPA: signal peptidase I [Candidatus Nanoarchaeia archaeon]|nr:signal peptidase I [Candidatus Nanoarchaeia archaeon]